jgi:hypothetical protein
MSNQDGKLILSVEPISTISPDDNNNVNICVDGTTIDNADDESSNNDDPKHNNDVATTITPTKEVMHVIFCYFNYNFNIFSTQIFSN